MSRSYTSQSARAEVYPALKHWQRLLLRKLDSLSLSRIQIDFGSDSNKKVTLGVIKPGIPVAHIQIISFKAILSALSSGVLGWSEAYLKGYWRSDDLMSTCNWAMFNLDKLEKGFSSKRLSTLYNRFLHIRNNNSRKGSKRNIEYHYDLGNDFYRLWLDESMSYSSALYLDQKESLKEAQLNKYRKVIEMASVKEGDTLLEIGCGWGGFAEEIMSIKGTKLHALTLSKEQLSWAQNRLQACGQNSRANFELKDYRDLEDSYDAVVSIEMFEAVGEDNWENYFQVLNRTLKPGAKAVLQVICIENNRFESYRENTDFIQKYVFPGGMLPSPEKVRELGKQAGLKLNSELEFGADYAKTLAIWRKSFYRAWPSLKQQGFDQKFKRMWEYYLCYCEAGFNYQSVDVRLFEFQKPQHGNGVA